MSVLAGDTNLAVNPHQKVKEEIALYKTSLPETPPDCPEGVARLLQEIHSCLFESDLTVEKGKDRCGISNNNISSRFRYYIGYSPSTYIIKHRLHLAKRLLRKHDITVSEVAFGVGYESAGAFSTMFKREEGVSPSRFSEESEKEGDDPSNP